MSKHTPGPWEFRAGYGRELVVYQKGKGASGYPVATLTKGSFELREDEATADARLIAAAPDMLEALKLVAEFGCECHDEAERNPCMVCIANEAIAKAEGK